MAKKQKHTWIQEKLAPASLWAAGVALLAVIVMLVIRFLISSKLYAPPKPELFQYILLGSALLVIVSLAVYALAVPDKVRKFLSGRQAKHGSNMGIMLVAFLGILIVINIIVAQNPTPSWWPADWTEDKQNTLAPETLDTLKALPASVHAIGFFTQNMSSASTEELLSKFKDKGEGKFDYEFVDPESNPLIARQYNVSRDGTVVLIMGDRQEPLTYVTEQELTNALIRLINPGERTVYFLTGHDEYDTTGSGERTYTRVKAVLETKNYTVNVLNLAAQHQIPEDALAIIIAGPTYPISADEMSLLEEYLAKGGALVVLEEPSLLTNFSTATDPLMDYLASAWGITFNDNFIIDTYSNRLNYAFAASYSTHTITQKLQNIISFFPSARSLTTEEIDGITTMPLVMTSQNSWGETNFVDLRNNQVSPDENDQYGPLTIAVAAENTTQKGRVVAFGDSDFASDTYFDQYANGDLLINSIDWAAHQENIINLTTHKPIQRTMKSLSQLTVLLIALGAVLILPGLVIAAGVASWLIRRSRG